MDNHTKSIKDEDGFILVAVLWFLVVLVLIGLSSMTNTSTEILIAGNGKAYKQNFYMAEGGSYIEADKVGLSSAYQVSDPGKSDQILTVIPPALQAAFKAGDPNTWPPSNLNTLSYNSLVTYLYADTPPKGYDASQFSTYKFRIDGARVTNGQVVIELGGDKIGVKVSM